MIKIEQLKYGWLSVRAWFAEKRATRRYGWWSGLIHAYLLAGLLQGLLFAHVMEEHGVNTNFGTVLKFSLIWPAKSYAEINHDLEVSMFIADFCLPAQQPSAPPNKRPAETRPA